jgi:hypothetical protein
MAGTTPGHDDENPSTSPCALVVAGIHDLLSSDRARGWLRQARP